MAVDDRIDVSGFFGQSTFADVRLLFGSQELKCHKIILSSQSEYFRNLFDPLSPFLYEEQDAECNTDLLHHLGVAVVADKYLLKRLRAKAQQTFERLATTVTAASQVFAIVFTLNREHKYDESLIVVRDQLIKRHLSALLQLEDFRVMLSQEVDLLFKLLENLAFAANTELKGGTGSARAVLYAP
ncbi:hypothetical protein LTR53_005041 [Teratosphaeriaceae sp. CCFEE 6253]|nr:hypothetical protein LTR53_005041 [Teratosphaeriaceae sp. CCFEE 6253]